MMRNRKKILIVMLVVVVLSLVYGALYVWFRGDVSFSEEIYPVVTIILAEMLVVGSLGMVYFKDLLRQPSHRLRRILLPRFILFVVLALLISLVLPVGISYLFMVFRGESDTNFFALLRSEMLPSIITQFGIWILVVSAFFFYSIWNDSIKRELRLRDEYSQFKYQRLKSQLSPHFFFNSLNALSELIHEDVQRADAFIHNLSGVYRYILENEETDFVPLAGELSMVDTYVSILRERESDKIALRVEVWHPEGYRVPPMSLQLLVENALKHNARSDSNPLVIRIYIEDDYVVVSNEVRRKSIMGGSTGIGLKNLSERLRLMMDRELIVSDDKHTFTVKIPLKQGQ